MPSPSAIAWARQSGVKLAANHLLDQPANPVTDSALDGIKPIVEKMGVNLGRRRRKLGRRGNPLHGVVSCSPLKRRVIRGSSPRGLRHHQLRPPERRARTRPTSFLTGSAAAGGIALINSISNLGGFVGPYAIRWILGAAGETTRGLVVRAASSIMAGVVTFLMGHDTKMEMSGSRMMAE